MTQADLFEEQKPREMHENSLDAHRKNKEAGMYTRRHREVLAVYRAAKSSLTDREIRNRLGYGDMNAVRPRINELIEMGDLLECGKIEDQETKRMVRLVRIVNKQAQYPD